MTGKYNYRLHLEQMFSELGVGENEEIDKITDNELAGLIQDIKDLFVEYPDGVENNTFIDNLSDIFNRYIGD